MKIPGSLPRKESIISKRDISIPAGTVLNDERIFAGTFFTLGDSRPRPRSRQMNTEWIRRDPTGGPPAPVRLFHSIRACLNNQDIRDGRMIFGFNQRPACSRAAVILRAGSRPGAAESVDIQSIKPSPLKCLTAEITKRSK